MSEAGPTEARPRRVYAPRLPADERRTQLVAAARRLIMREGYPGLTADAVAAEAGVSKPVIYGVFDNLGDLVREVLEQWQREAIEQLFTRREPGSIERTEVARMVDHWCAVVTENPETWALIFRPRAGAPAEVHEQIERGREAARQRIAQAFDLMLPDSAPARNRLLAEVVVASGEHLGRRLLDDPASCSVDDWAGLFEDLIYGSGNSPPKDVEGGSAT